jgi:hypothetical protein
VPQTKSRRNGRRRQCSQGNATSHTRQMPMRFTFTDLHQLSLMVQQLLVSSLPADTHTGTTAGRQQRSTGTVTNRPRKHAQTHGNRRDDRQGARSKWVRERTAGGSSSSSSSSSSSHHDSLHVARDRDVHNSQRKRNNNRGWHTTRRWATEEPNIPYPTGTVPNVLLALQHERTLVTLVEPRQVHVAAKGSRASFGEKTGAT